MEVVAKKPKVLKQPLLRYKSFKDDWKVELLGEMLTFKNGVNAEKEHYGSGYKFINVLDILQNDFITHDVIIGSVELSEADFKKNEVVYGDILFQRSSETREEVGQANVYLDKKHTAAFGGFVIWCKGGQGGCGNHRRNAKQQYPIGPWCARCKPQWRDASSVDDHARFFVDFPRATLLPRFMIFEEAADQTEFAQLRRHTTAHHQQPKPRRSLYWH